MPTESDSDDKPDNLPTAARLAAVRPQTHRLLSDEETKIWEAADRGTDDMNPAWRELQKKFAEEIEKERADELAIRMTTCVNCGERCNRMMRRELGEAPWWVSYCCQAPLPPEPEPADEVSR